MEHHYFQEFRKNYLQSQIPFIADDPPTDPYHIFDTWLVLAQKKEKEEPNAMVLGTVSPQRTPSTRVVLLKEYHVTNGFVFFTNYNSKKARDIEDNPSVTLLFFWPQVARQIHIQGEATRLSSQKSDAYFATRPRESQIASWASFQSKEIASREELEQNYLETEKKFLDLSTVPRPSFWGGYTVQPKRFEFWQGQKNRLHDRLMYYQRDGSWQHQRLSP